ncbi:MAG: hypothetical protein CM15mV22_1600 [Eurybiavirus sp.]|nr:MAG: hypothetical protein CM15mV22_1600 [Eurybiavirus sp.]
MVVQVGNSHLEHSSQQVVEQRDGWSWRWTSWWVVVQVRGERRFSELWGGSASRGVNGTLDFSLGHTGGRWYNSGTSGGDPFGLVAVVLVVEVTSQDVDMLVLVVMVKPKNFIWNTYGDNGYFGGGVAVAGADDNSNYNSNNSGYRVLVVLAVAVGGGGVTTWASADGFLVKLLTLVVAVEEVTEVLLNSTVEQVERCCNC